MSSWKVPLPAAAPDAGNAHFVLALRGCGQRVELKGQLPMADVALALAALVQAQAKKSGHSAQAPAPASVPAPAPAMPLAGCSGAAELADKLCAIVASGAEPASLREAFLQEIAATLAARPSAHVQAGAGPLFVAKAAANKWAQAQAEGARMSLIVFDGHKSGQRGSIDPWGVVRWGETALAALASGSETPGAS